MRDKPAPREIVEHRRRAAASDVVNYVAGNVAEFRFRGRSRVEIKFACVQMADACLAEPPGARTDYGLARNRLEWITPGAERNAFMHAWLAGEGIMASWWSGILLLAGELERRGRLVDEELYPLWNGMRDARTKQALAHARRTGCPGIAPMRARRVSAASSSS
jgi:hypothetical protein